MKNWIYSSFVFFGILFVSNSYGQVNFFTKDVDSSANTFFAREKTITSVANYSMASQTYGISTLIHNNIDYLSYYFHVSTNVLSHKIVQGTHIESSHMQQTSIPYTHIITHFGLAHSFTKNVFFYAHTGFVFTQSNFSNADSPEYVYSHIPSGMNALLGAGLFYITNSNWSFQVGLYSYERNFIFGVGYTL